MRDPLALKEDFELPVGQNFLCAATMGTVLQRMRAAEAEYARTRVLGNDVTEVFTAKAMATRQDVATLLGAPGAPSVFFSGNCTIAQDLVARSLVLTEGDVVVTAQTPYCGSWLHSTGRVRMVPHQTTEAYLAVIDELMRNPPEGRVVVSAEAVEYVNGMKLDIPRIYQAVKALPVEGVLAVDVSQWWGKFQAMEFADVIFMTGNKWLFAAHGVAVTWVNPDLLPKLHPPIAGWRHGGRNTASGMADLLTAMEPGGKPWGPLWTLADSTRYLLDLGGLHALEAHIAPLVELATKLLDEGGVPLLSPREPTWQSGNVCFGLVDTKAMEAFHDRLKRETGVALSFGGDVPRLRLTPGPYTTTQDIHDAAEHIVRMWKARR